jgi:hypothetical protein
MQTISQKLHKIEKYEKNNEKTAKKLQKTLTKK